MLIRRVMLSLAAAVLTAGAETRVVIEGTQQKSAAGLLDSLGGRLTHVRDSPASAPLADDAAFLLRQLMHKDGYMNATVDWRIASRDEIILRVHEGTRQSLGSVTVTGVPKNETKKYAKLFSKPAKKEQTLGGGPPPFREVDVATGLAYLQQDFNARGYWAAEAAEVARSRDAASGAVNLTIEVRPGALYQIGRPVVVGDGVAATVARPFVGRPATTANLNAMRLAVEESISSSGYPDAEIRMSQNLAAGIFVPEFSIQMGARVQLRHLHIDGLERTNPERVARRFRQLEGQWYNEAAMSKRLREFLTTGAFSSARVETTAVGDSLVDATLHFEEARAKSFGLAAGVGTYQGVLTRVTYADRNLFGNLLGLDAGIEMGSRGVLGDVSVTDPWLLGSEIAGTARAFALIYTREGYDTYETGLEGKLTWKPDSHYSLELLAGYALVNLTAAGLPLDALGETVYTHPRLRITQKLDYRDNPVLPQRGWHLECPLEIGAAIGDISSTYTMAGLAAGWYHRLGESYQLGIGGACSVIMPGGASGDLPIDLRLFNGGARSVRSFPERELGVELEGYPLGGEVSWHTNLELSRNISSMVKAVAFFDAGSLEGNYQDFGSSQVELAAGLGLRFDLPIGPIRLEYGHNLTRDPGEPVGTYHFAIGWAY